MMENVNCEFGVSASSKSIAATVVMYLGPGCSPIPEPLPGSLIAGEGVSPTGVKSSLAETIKVSSTKLGDSSFTSVTRMITGTEVLAPEG